MLNPTPSPSPSLFTLKLSFIATFPMLPEAHCTTGVDTDAQRLGKKAPPWPECGGKLSSLGERRGVAAARPRCTTPALLLGSLGEPVRGCLWGEEFRAPPSSLCDQVLKGTLGYGAAG